MSTRTGPVIRSDECGLDALIGSFTGDEALRGRLVLGRSWTRRWSTAWLLGGGEVVWPVRDLGSVPVLDSRPGPVRPP
ncbi:hypothetical protein [Kitasatospora sp. NPDC098663]|uniref:hypothetical protein n=1 Tax=Kitasatospora sp. NPDC098663 TaxID=3364096 RepID=UPI0037F35944